MYQIVSYWIGIANILKPYSDHFWNLGEICIFSPKIFISVYLDEYLCYGNNSLFRMKLIFQSLKNKSFLPLFLHIQQHKFEKKLVTLKMVFWRWSNFQKSILNPNNYLRKNYQTFRGDSVDFRVVIGYFSGRKSRATRKVNGISRTVGWS